MAKVTVHWQVATDKELPREAHFFLYREGDPVHHDHRFYSHEELERRVAAILANAGVVPDYYRLALEAFEDSQAPREGAVPLDTGR
ncbi:MAG TPA: hypothetical protein VGV61_15400 [Thermoanaerobaculia bacterium]|nr:hypothetical protein [Thermoanaerobaculia bacterium]